MGKKTWRDILTNFRLFFLVLSLFIIVTSCAKTDEATTETAAVTTPQTAEPTQIGGNNISDYVILYPDIFTDREKPLVEKWIADNKAIEARGPIDVKALISGTLPKDTPGVISGSLKATEEMIRYNNNKYDPENPVLNDAAYAKKLGYENIFGMPTFAANDDNILKAYPAEARDKLLVSDLNHSITYYKPIYPGDTLYTVINKRSFVDGTPEEGSIFRAVCMQTEASIYNQKGEKVNDCIFRVTENIGILKEGAQKASGGMNPAWIGPAWTSRPMHIYTDADWNYIKELWSKEKRQDGTPLYWEDVKVGDEPTWTVDGPIMATANPTRPYGQGVGGSRTLKKEIMDPAIFNTMYKDENGIWLTTNREDYIPTPPSTGDQGGRGAAPQGAGQGGAPDQGGATGAQGGPPQGGAPASTGPASDIDTTEIHKQVGSERAVLINYVGRDIAIRHIDNWMGDKGWIYNIRWSIMAPSALASVGLEVAANPFSERFVDQVPKLKAANKVVNAHGLTYELAIVKSYVAKKYQKDNEYFVDLIWWIENLDGYIWEEGGATVRLPSINAM